MNYGIFNNTLQYAIYLVTIRMQESDDLEHSCQVAYFFLP